MVECTCGSIERKGGHWTDCPVILYARAHDLYLQVKDLETLARRFIAGRACVCNIPGHRCGTNQMLEDLETVMKGGALPKAEESTKKLDSA